jgi:hypothetical protein
MLQFGFWPARFVTSQANRITRKFDLAEVLLGKEMSLERVRHVVRERRRRYCEPVDTQKQ